MLGEAEKRPSAGLQTESGNVAALLKGKETFRSSGIMNGDLKGFTVDGEAVLMQEALGRRAVRDCAGETGAFFETAYKGHERAF